MKGGPFGVVLDRIGGRAFGNPRQRRNSAVGRQSLPRRAAAGPRGDSTSEVLLSCKMEGTLLGLLTWPETAPVGGMSDHRVLPVIT